MPFVRSLRRRAVALLVAAAVLPLAVTLPAAAGQTDPGATTSTTLDPHTALAQNKQQRAQVGSQIGSLSTSDAQVKKSLAALDGRLSAANAAMTAAEVASQQAQAALTSADTAEKTARAAAEESRRQIKQLAIQAYVNPESQSLVEVLASSSIGEASERQAIIEVRAHQKAQLLAQRRATLAQLKRQHEAAKQAAAAADAAQTQQQQAISQIQAARNQQTQLVADVDQRLDAALGEAAGLDQVDAKLANQITQQQEQLRAEVLSQQAVAVPTTSTTTPKSTSGSSGKSGTKATTTTTTVPSQAPVVPPPLYTMADMKLVGGIYVNKLIAAQVQGLLNAATAAGLTLTGGGYRDPQAQIQTRMNNCGTSEYAIYEEPASQCSPPTAHPGTSMHEQGMAIDFSCSGVLIQTHTDPCWIWLDQNAASYGLYNLASEPWHWSVNGN